MSYRLPVATVFHTNPDQLIQSLMPVDVNFQACLFGYEDKKETYIYIWSGLWRNGPPSNSIIAVTSETSSDWDERIPRMAERIAKSIDAVVAPVTDRVQSFIHLAHKPTLRQVGLWVKEWSEFFEERQYPKIDRVRFKEVSEEVMRKSRLEYRTDVQ